MLLSEFVLAIKFHKLNMQTEYFVTIKEVARHSKGTLISTNIQFRKSKDEMEKSEPHNLPTSCTVSAYECIDGADNTQYTLLFVIHIVLGCNILDLNVGPQLLNICQSVKGKSWVREVHYN